MINKISIRNFKCLRDVQIDLERFTVFVGPNASGKSSILQAMDFVCRSFRNQPEEVAGELSEAVSQGTNDDVELAAESGGSAYRYRTHQPVADGNPQSGKARGHGRYPVASPGVVVGCEVASDLNSDNWKPWVPGKGNRSPLPLSVLLRLEASKLVSAVNLVANPLVAVINSKPADPTIMAPDGSGLHSALANMALNDPDSWQQLQADLRRIIPTIRRLRHTKTGAQHPAALLFDTFGADSLPASQVSEGTLMVLGLLAALHAPSRPSLVLLDDLDRGLHPKAQKELISLLRGLQQANAELQIVATTHSPYMLDCMETNEVRMTFLGDDGATACGTLPSHPEFDKWKDEMAPGEMWSLFGESWLAGKGATT